MSKETGQSMQMLSTVLGPDKAIACPECGAHVFFDWGLKVLFRDSGGVGPRVQNWATNGGVQVCATCHHPVIWMGGDYYDGVEYFPKDTIEKLIREGQAREHAVPIRTMDP
jgi:hypothetical protein